MVKCTPTKVWKKYNATTFNFTHTTKHNALNYLKKGIDLSLLKMKGLCLKRVNENGKREIHGLLSKICSLVYSSLDSFRRRSS